MMNQVRESIIFLENGEAKLRYCGIEHGSLELYYDYKCDEDYYKEGIDFCVDYERGMVKLLSKRIQSYQDSCFYGMDKFNHEEVKDYGNYEFIYHVDYCFNERLQKTDEELAVELAKDSIKLCLTEEKLRYIVFGDSISTGLEATKDQYMYFNRVKKYIEQTYKIEIELKNAAVGGENSNDGMKRFHREVLENNPDIVSIAYGMNDQCLKKDGSGNFVSPDAYKENIEFMIKELINIGSKVVLISPCISNPRWVFSSGDIPIYAQVLKTLAAEYKLPFVDVTALWQEVLSRGKTSESLLYNDINHPTDYGHQLYYYMFKEIICSNQP